MQRYNEIYLIYMSYILEILVDFLSSLYQLYLKANPAPLDINGNVVYGGEQFLMYAYYLINFSFFILAAYYVFLLIKKYKYRIHINILKNLFLLAGIFILDLTLYFGDLNPLIMCSYAFKFMIICFIAVIVMGILQIIRNKTTVSL